MKLRRLIVNNFRPFYGKKQIDFADGEKSNITVIFGNNGAGKTTLLNAFMWCLYEKFSSDFELPELLINKRAVSDAAEGDEVECSVELQFEHEGRDYSLIRTNRGKKKNGLVQEAETEAQLWEHGETGSPPIDGQALKDQIGRILPVDLQKYFFFNGERIDDVVRPDKKAEIADATKVLLGVEILTRAKEHLTKARRELEHEWRSMGDSDTQALLDKKAKLEKEKDEIEESLKVIADELKNQALLKSDYNKQLAALTEVKALIAERDRLDENQRTLRATVQDLENKVKKDISEKAFQVFLLEPAVEVKRIVEELRVKNQLPAPMKVQFVQDLLEREKCICGSALSHGSDSFEAVSAWLQVSSEDGVEQRISIMGAKLKELDGNVDEFWHGLDDKQISIQSTKEALVKIENELGDLKERLRNSPSEDIQQLSKRLEECEAIIKNQTIDKGRKEQKLVDLERDIKEINDDIRKLEEKQGKQSQARRRCDAADEAVDCLEELRKRLGEQFRLQLEQKLQKIFSKMVVYPHVPKLDPNYELAVFESTTGKELPVPKSTGQSQVLCLAFIVSIIDCVREWKAKNPAMVGLDSTTFPMVIDSAFSNLDEINGRQVARCIPDLVNQLVLFVNKTQWRQEVAEEIGPRVGRKYVLCYETPEKDKPSDSLTLDGREYDLVKHSRDNFDYTELVEI